MEIQQKPDYFIFAEDAKTGEITDFPNIKRGWGVTLDQTQGKPPLEWFNSAFNRIDKNALYLLQQGVPEWSADVLYPIGAIIKVSGNLYKATRQSANLSPDNSPNDWELFIDDASLTKKGIVKLSSEVNSTVENQAATPKAVKTAYDLANNALPLTGGTVTGNTNFTGKLQQAGDDVITTANVSSLFENKLTDSGYQKLPNGLIIQWQNNFAPTGSNITLPISFPNKALTVIVGNSDRQGDGVDNAYGYVVDNSTVFVELKAQNNRTNQIYKVSYIAIGY